MNIYFNSEGSMVIPKEDIAALLQAANAKNFHQAELEFVTHWQSLGAKAFEELLAAQASPEKKTPDTLRPQ